MLGIITVYTMKTSTALVLLASAAVEAHCTCQVLSIP